MEKSSSQRLWASLVLAFICLLAPAIDVRAQGGKAEPKRIEFERGRSNAVVSRRLSVGQEMEYVFGANKDQTVTIKNASGKLFDGRVFSHESDFVREVGSSGTLTFRVPQSGDYMFFVRKKQKSTPRSARFSFTLSIKRP